MKTNVYNKSWLPPLSCPIQSVCAHHRWDYMVTLILWLLGQDSGRGPGNLFYSPDTVNLWHHNVLVWQEMYGTSSFQLINIHQNDGAIPFTTNLWFHTSSLSVDTSTNLCLDYFQINKYITKYLCTCYYYIRWGCSVDVLSLVLVKVVRRLKHSFNRKLFSLLFSLL